MPRSRTPQKFLARPVGEARARSSLPIVDEIGDLAWAGQHAQAIERATAALATTGANTALKLDLLDLRAESLVALGDTERAGADAAAPAYCSVMPTLTPEG